MLQHSSNLTAEGWLFERDLLKQFLELDASPSEVWRKIAPDVDSRRRVFKIKSKDGRRFSMAGLELRDHSVRDTGRPIVLTSLPGLGLHLWPASK
jgi:hypothetical protein